MYSFFYLLFLPLAWKSKTLLEEIPENLNWIELCQEYEKESKISYIATPSIIINAVYYNITNSHPNLYKFDEF